MGRFLTPGTLPRPREVCLGSPDLARVAAMMLKMKCRWCRRPIEFVDAQAGHTIFCPQCNKEVVLRVPRTSYLKVLFVTLLLGGVVGGGGYAAWSMLPGVKRTA